MLIEAMAFPRQGLSSAGVQPKPGRGKKAEGLDSAPVSGRSRGVVVAGHPFHPAPCADPSPHCISSQTPAVPLSPSLLLPAKEGSGGQPKQREEFNSPPSQINIQICTLNKPVCQVQSFKSIRTKGLINVCSRASGAGGGFIIMGGSGTCFVQESGCNQNILQEAVVLNKPFFVLEYN